MCVPLAAGLAIASVATSVMGSVVGAAGQLAQGRQANAQGKYEAQVDRINEGLEVEASHQSVLAGQDERRDFWRKVAQVKGQQIASMAANGIDVGYGSAERVQEDTQMLANDDAKSLYRNIEERTRGHLIQASNYESAAKAARARGKAAQINSRFAAAGTILGGASQAFGMASKMATGGLNSAGT